MRFNEFNMYNYLQMNIKINYISQNVLLYIYTACTKQSFLMFF